MIMAHGEMNIKKIERQIFYVRRNSVENLNAHVVGTFLIK